MCPGRFLANDKVMQLIALVLTRLDVELLRSELPPLDQRRAGLGVLPPVGEVHAGIRRIPARLIVGASAATMYWPANTRGCRLRGAPG